MRFVSSDSVTVTSASADEIPSSRSTSGFVPSAQMMVASGRSVFMTRQRAGSRSMIVEWMRIRASSAMMTSACPARANVSAMSSSGRMTCASRCRPMRERMMFAPSRSSTEGLMSQTVMPSSS